MAGPPLTARGITVGAMAGSVATQGTTALAATHPWLLDEVPADRRSWVERNLVVPTIRLAAGPLDVDALPRPAVGLLVDDGLLTRRLTVHGYTGSALISEGDLLRPWTYEGRVATIPAEAHLRALTEVELALLDERFLEVVARVPEISVGLYERCVERSRMQAYFLAVRAVVRIDERLLLTLWHLAERYGRVTVEGVVLRLPRVSHDLLAEMLGARRPSVTSAVNALEERGLLERPGRGTWILKGPPPEALER